MNRPWTCLLMIAAAGILSWTTPARAQLSIPGAGDDKFGLIRDANNTVSLTTDSDGVSFNWSTDKAKTVGDCQGLLPHSPELTKCLLGLSDKPFSLDFKLGVTGEKGKGSILSKGILHPGSSFGMTALYRLEPSGANGYTDFYASIAGSLTQEHVAQLPQSASASIEDATEKQIGVTAGVNRYFSQHFAIGGGGGIKRALLTPGTQTAITLCDTQSGTSKDGHTIEVSDCNDGFKGPLPNQWVGSLRAETMYNFNHFEGTVAKPKPAVSVGVIASLNVTRRTDVPTQGNLAFGPVLHPKGSPHKALLALVVKYADITNAATGNKTARERLSAVLWFGIPLTGF